MDDEVITTGVDDLLAYLKGKDKIALQDAAKVLDIPQETLQAWVDFLVEEKILGIEYKFTKPFIYLNREETEERAKIIEETSQSIEDVKEGYVRHAREKKMPEEKIPRFWRIHVLEALEHKKGYFMEQARSRNVEDPEEMWEQYKKNLLARC